jgi:hypothetical protein
LNKSLDVRYWHKADIRFGAMQCPLLGVKRTSQISKFMGAAKAMCASTCVRLRPDVLARRRKYPALMNVPPLHKSTVAG